MSALVALIPIVYFLTALAGFKMAGWLAGRTTMLLAIILGSTAFNMPFSFAATLYLSSNFMGPELPAILSAFVSLICTVLLLKVWKPATVWKYPDEEQTTTAEQPNRSFGSILTAWSPFIILTASISIWTLQPVKDFFKAFVVQIPVPLIHNHIVSATTGKDIAAFFKLDFFGATSTAILCAAIIAKFIISISWSDMVEVFADTFRETKFALLTICFVVGFAYVMNASGMTNTLGSALAATNLVGRESELRKYTIRHSVFLITLIAILVYLQSTPCARLDDTHASITSTSPFLALPLLRERFLLGTQKNKMYPLFFTRGFLRAKLVRYYKGRANESIRPNFEEDFYAERK